MSARIDVTELLHDADFVDAIQLITRTPSVSSQGVVTFTESTLNTYGSVQPAPANAVDKVPEAMRTKDLKSFFVQATIVASESGHYSSILVFAGLRYQVLSVSDFSNWGAGWTEGLCVVETLAP